MLEIDSTVATLGMDLGEKIYGRHPMEEIEKNLNSVLTDTTAETQVRAMLNGLADAPIAHQTATVRRAGRDRDPGNRSM